MLGFKSTTTAEIILSSIEMVHMMRKRQARFAYKSHALHCQAVRNAAACAPRDAQPALATSDGVCDGTSAVTTVLIMEILA
ncbi:hypothetical protein X765_30740 [Mesorhizobium sp. LSHC440B00]|nr:hypothetical protein X765_30740 [Mesorhizobium sp. LSHC440B00]